MKRIALLVVALCFVLVASTVVFADVNPIKLLVNGQEVKSDVNPTMLNNRVLVPARALAEALGFEVTWENNAVIIKKTAGDTYLHGKNDPSQSKPTIHTNFVKNVDLLAALDDDNDGDLCDYRDGHNGGDNIANDPLVVDARLQTDYDAGHIPGAIWIAEAQNIVQSDNLAKLKEALATHVGEGGKNEIVVYCYTGNTAGLATGVLGAEGLNVKNMRFGYSIAWEGTKQADASINGPKEDKDGKPVPYATPVVK